MNAYRTLVVCLFGTFALTVAAAGARGQSTEPPATDPAALAERCIEHMTAVANRAVEHIEAHGENASARVAELVEAGEFRKAVAVARAASQHVKLDAYRAGHKITKPAYRCIKSLLRLGEPELAAEVEAAAKEQVDRVKGARRIALEAIRDALPDNESGVVE